MKLESKFIHTAIQETLITKQSIEILLQDNHQPDVYLMLMASSCHHQLPNDVEY